MDIRQALILLNLYLKRLEKTSSFIICGGASLILQGIISRATRDVDVVAPPIDAALREAAVHVANDLKLDAHWLNDGPSSLVRDLAPGWEKRVEEVFRDTNLVVYSIARKDLIFSKFWAMCDRQEDKQDVLLLRPSKEELRNVVEYTKTKDANPDWPEWVIKQGHRIGKELGYE
jgi:hypothetical protein